MAKLEDLKVHKPSKKVWIDCIPVVSRSHLSEEDRIAILGGYIPSLQVESGANAMFFYVRLPKDGIGLPMTGVKRLTDDVRKLLHTIATKGYYRVRMDTDGTVFDDLKTYD